MNEVARDRAGSSQRRHIEHDLLLAALPHPVLVLGDDDRVLYANLAAETFFSLSHGMLALAARKAAVNAVGLIGLTENMLT